jgi:hypothetical protein
VQALGLRVPVTLVMARPPMPKALSPLQSGQRSYTSKFSVSEIDIENGAAERELEIESGVHTVGDWIIEIISCNWLKCVINAVDNPIPVYSHLKA